MLNHLGARGAVPMIGGSASPVPANVAETTDLEPLNGHIFVLPDRPPEKVGELFVPPSQAQACSGTVIATTGEYASTQVGDRVAYSGFWPFEFEGKTHVCVMEKHLVGVKRKAKVQASADEAAYARAEGEGMPSAKNRSVIADA